ncbi:MAG: hypothetical protein A2Y91_03490 [Chloroflexi bacterium RBG_13_54_8]|nr:MAG: hypothetical protein A2Y91_03490 [Chloroflexi bacterium RBG_13_54_8]
MTNELQGMDEFRRNLAKLGDKMADGLEAAVLVGAMLIRNDAVPRAPFLTGTLRRSIHTETIEKSAEQVVVSVGTDVIYAAIQEFGGLIEAKNAPNLVFQSPKGVWHSVKSVQIPPHPYLRPALDENKDRAQEEIKEALADIVEAM